MKCSLTDRCPSLTCGKLLIGFNIDLIFFLRSRLKHWCSLDLDFAGVRSAFGWRCKVGETGGTRGAGAEGGELRLAENGEFETLKLLKLAI